MLRSNPILPVKGRVNCGALTTVKLISRLPSWGSSPSKAGSGKVCSLRDRRLCEAVIDVVVTNANAEAGKQCRAILPSYKNAVCQSSGGTAAKSRQGSLPPGRLRISSFYHPGCIPTKRKRQPGIALGVNLLDLNGTYLLPVGDAIEAGTGYRISFSILCNVNGEYLVAQLYPSGALVSGWYSVHTEDAPNGTPRCRVRPRPVPRA